MNAAKLEHALDAIGWLKEFARMIPEGYIRPAVDRRPPPPGEPLGSYAHSTTLRSAYEKDAELDAPKSVDSIYKERAAAIVPKHPSSTLEQRRGLAERRLRDGGLLVLPPEHSLRNVIPRPAGSEPGGSDYGVLVRNAQKGIHRHEITHSVLQQRRGGPPKSIASAFVEELAANKNQFLGKKSPNRSCSLADRIKSTIRGAYRSTKYQVDKGYITKWFERAGYQAALDEARNRTDRDPTEGQKKAGNYRKGSLSFQGIPVTLENPRGSIRRGIDDDGKPWSNEMHADYGYIPRTKGKDGDQVDVFLGPSHRSQLVVAVDQHKGEAFDETKFILGCDTRDQAEKLYLAHYPKGWKLGPVSTCTIDQFKEWLSLSHPGRMGHMKQPFRGQGLKALTAALKGMKQFGIGGVTIIKPVSIFKAAPILKSVRRHLEKNPQDRTAVRSVFGVVGRNPASRVRMPRMIEHAGEKKILHYRGGGGEYTEGNPITRPYSEKSQQPIDSETAFRRHVIIPQNTGIISTSVDRKEAIQRLKPGGAMEGVFATSLSDLIKNQRSKTSQAIVNNRHPREREITQNHADNLLKIRNHKSKWIGEDLRFLRKQQSTELTAREQGMKQFEKPFLRYSAKRHARTGGLNDSFREKYNKENGSHLQRPVTTKPSELKPGSKAAKRRDSFCARMGGVPGPTSKDGKLTPKGAALKRWNCSALVRGIKLFSQTPEEERHELLKTGILSTGLAAGLALGARGLRGTVGEAEKLAIKRSTASKIASARRNARVAGETRAAESAKTAKVAARDRYKAGNASFQNLARNPNLTKGEKATVKRVHGLWKSANPGKEFSEGDRKHTLRRAALIGAGALGGGILGARTLPRLLGKGRPMREGESLLGKVVYNHQGVTTPMEVIHVGGKSIQSRLHRAAKGNDFKAHAARAALKADEFIGIPQRHYAVGVGSGRVAEVSKTHGRRIIPQETLGTKIYVEKEGKVLRDPHVESRHVGRSGTINEHEADAFNQRYEQAGSDPRFKRCNINPASHNNCESYARGIAGYGFKSNQISAMTHGAIGGAVLGGSAAALATHPRKKQFEQPIILRQKRDTLSRVRDAASLGAGLGVIGLTGYTGMRVHGLAKQISKEVPGVARVVKSELPGLAAYGKATLRKISKAAGGVQKTADTVRRGPIGEGAPGWLKKNLSSRLSTMKTFSSDDEPRRRSIALPLLAAAAGGAALASTPHAIAGIRRVERVAKKSARSVGILAENASKMQENLKHSTSAYADAGRIYSEAKGGVYNLLHPINTLRETKAAFKAGLQGKSYYPTRQRPSWALAARLQGLKKFALKSDEDGIPYTGRVARDRFVKQIHERDLDRRDRNIDHAVLAGGAAGLLTAGSGSPIKARLIRAGLGAGAGLGGVLAIRAATDGHRDIYGDRPRWAKRAEAIPAIAGIGTAGALIAKKAKLFAADDREDAGHQVLKAGISGAASGALLGGGTALLTRGKSLKSALQAAGIGAGAMGALAGGGTAIGNKVLGNADPNDKAAFTKRAAVGGAIAGAALGGIGAVGLKKGLFGSRIADGFAKGAKTWRPLYAIERSSAPVAAAVGAGAGALYGAHQGADEGMMIDAINNSTTQPRKAFASRLRRSLKLFGYDSQPRHRDSGKFLNPREVAWGIHGNSSVDSSGNSPSSFDPRAIGSFYRKGKEIHRAGGRVSGLLRDAGDVLAGRGRRTDQAGRPQKREWEKAWFHRAVGGAATGGALLGGALLTSKTKFGQDHLLPWVKAAHNTVKPFGLTLASAKLSRLKQFDLDAALSGWDVRDPRGRSARVFAPGSRPRFRREKEWHEKKENREALLKGAIVGTGLLGAAAGVAATRKLSGLPIIPRMTKKVVYAGPKDHLGSNIIAAPIEFRPRGAA